MRVVFMGSPEFALPTLRRLIESRHEIVGVITQPDRPVGRGRRAAPPPVKSLALAHGLRVLQPESVGAPDAVEELRSLRPDIGVLAAYGQILRQRVLDVPPLGILNVHASLLPRWRGAAPVAAAILAGDGETGATIMRVVRELDAGPILDSARVPIAANDTTGTLTAKIAEAGATLLSEILPRYAAGELTPIDQDDAQATYAPQIKKADALIHWERDDAETIARKVRAYNPWPMAFARLDGQPLRIVEAQGVDEDSSRQPGTIFETKLDEQSSFAIAASRGSLNVRTVQPPGGRAMSAAAYLRGHRDIIGKRFALNGAN